MYKKTVINNGKGEKNSTKSFFGRGGGGAGEGCLIKVMTSLAFSGVGIDY